jgi:hypothetical protein
LSFRGEEFSIGYAVQVRPSSVLGTRVLELAYHGQTLPRNTGILPVSSGGHSARSGQAASLPHRSGETPELRLIFVDLS